MALDPESTAWVVRQTARASAVLFSVYLLGCAAVRGRSAVRRQLPLVFLAYVAAHSIHFACVVALAVATQGANIAARGGWELAVGSGILFYAALIWIGLGEVRPLAAGRSRRGWPAIATLGIWGAFFQAWATRPDESPTFAILALLLSIALVIYLTSLPRGRRNAGADL